MIEAHCHRERRNRSTLLVNAKRLRGTSPIEVGASARARKHATAKKPAINSSTSSD